MTIKQALDVFIPFNLQEQVDKLFFIKCLNTFEDVLTRENQICHICSTAFIVNKQRTKVLCAHHNIFGSWGWVGGHIDGVNDLEYVAEKEAHEETSIKHLKLLYNKPISIDSLPVGGHIKNGKYIPAHLHLCFTFLFEADENEKVKIKPDENSGVKWLTFEELIQGCIEPQMVVVYSKIVEKIKKLF